PKSLDTTPFGPLSESTSRKVFAYLIGILNAQYPDNDFTSLEPMDFIKISFSSLRSKFDNTLISLGKSEDMEFLWDIVNSQMDLQDCVYFELNTEDDEKFFLSEEPGQLWTMKWFIFNKKKKRVASLYLDGFRLNNS
ncbi:RNA polymerase III-inhibiting protein MAF1, partial [Cyberlindnera jadinii NRRL Y-1542]